LAEIEEGMEMKPEEYRAYFEDFIFIADKEFGQKEPFADASGGETGRRPGSSLVAKRQMSNISK
jgi:hypothetical protein